MSTFPAAFRELVMPDLRKMCRVQGLLVALDLRSFGESAATVWRAASKHGATMLPSQLLLELEEWIQITILKAELEFTPSVDERRELVDRVAADVDGYFDRFSAAQAVDCEAAWQTT